MNEARFETELIQYLSSGTIPVTKGAGNGLQSKESASEYCIRTKLWSYEPEIKTTEQLWQNFKEILERHNQSTLDHPLSVVEFNQVKRQISDIATPYEAGQFLYGLNGVSQLEIDLDDHAADFDGSGKWLKRLEGNILWLNGEYVALSGVQQNNPDDSCIVKISAIRYIIVHNKE